MSLLTDVHAFAAADEAAPDCAQILTQMLEHFRLDPDLDEILVNSVSGLWLVKANASVQASSPFVDPVEMVLWLQEFASSQALRLDPLQPAAGGRYDESHLGMEFRWHALIPPVSQDGPLFSLRRQRFTLLNVADFSGDETVKRELTRVYHEGRPLLIAGPTGSGKTTLLCSLLAEHSRQERVFILEHLSELPKLSPSWVRLVERQANLDGYGAITLRQLLAESLRLRPDRLVVGEIRGHEAWPFLQAMMSGHRGVLATIHAGTAEEAVHRLVTLAIQPGISVTELRSIVASQGGIVVACLKRGEIGGAPRLVDVSHAMF